MRKILSLFLVLAMLITMAPAVMADKALPDVGDVVEGFVVTSVGRFELVGADLVMFRHQKTGAELMYIANADTNRVFEITFRTPCLTNTGTPHVFEHSTLDGSDKYPSKSLFFNLSYQTYNTYMNASTYNFMTTYPVASLSEVQLLAYADFYTDSCLHPMLLRDESIFREEAWRYSLTDADSELELAGTVYSEMLGAMDQSSTAYFNFMNDAFPGSTKANEAGGMPEAIPSLTYEDVCAYHAAYYHPSNSLTCLYGSFEDYTAFLRLLDGYFSEYEQKEIRISDDSYTPITGHVTNTWQYPLEAGAATENASDIYYGIICDSTDDADVEKLDLLTTLLNDPGSAISQAVRERFPAGSFSSYVDFTTPELVVVFALSGVNENEGEAFRETVNEALAATARDGLDAENVSAIATNTKMSILLIGENSSLGVSLIPNIAYYWAVKDDVNGYQHSIDILNLFEEYNESGAYSEVIERLLLNSSRTVLSITVPAPGLKEENDAALAEQLAQVKAAMTPEEIGAIVAQTASLAQPDDSDASQYIDMLQAVTVSSLPEEARIYEISDTTENGIRYMTANANADGVARVGLMLDADGLETEQLLTLKLYSDLLGDMDTSAHSRSQLAALAARYLYSETVTTSMPDVDDEDGLHPYLRLSFTSLDEDLDAAYELLYELLYDSDLTNTQRLSDSVSRLKTSLKKDIDSSAYAINIYRVMGISDPSMAGYCYTHFLDYYDYLCSIEQRLTDEPDTVIAELTAIRAALHNRAGAIVLCSGNTASAAANKASADAFLAKLDCVPVEAKLHSFPTPQGNEALILNSSVQYNMVYASYEDLGHDAFEGAMDAVAALVTDSYLLPMLRDQYGVYGVLHSFAQSGVYIETYRDTNISETFAVYDALPEAIAAMDISQEDIDNYILSSYSAYALGSGELTGGESALLTVLNGDHQEDVLSNMHSLKSITAESFRSYAELYTALMEKGIRMTIGGASAISSCADLYETILDPFGTASAPLPSDLEANSIFAAASLFCRESGLMEDAAGDRFGVEDAATKGDLAAAMYAAIGGSCDAEEALTFWTDYGVMVGSADDPLSREDLAVFGCRFLTLMEVDTAADALQGYADADLLDEEAALSFSFALANELMLPREGALLAAQETATRGEVALYIQGICS